MRKIDKLLYRAIAPPFFISLAVLTFVLFVRYLNSLSELLITRNASLGVVMAITGAILPGILIFSLPLSYLIGILIGLTGLSGESQVIALRACGIPLRTLLRFIFCFGAGVAIATGVLSITVLPMTNDLLADIKQKISLSQATSQVQPRVFNEDFSNIVFYVDDLAADRQHWSRVFLADNSDPQTPRTVLAKSGMLVTDPLKRRLQLHLENGSSYSRDADDPAKDNYSFFASTDIPVPSKDSSITEAEAAQRPRKVVEQSTRYLWTDWHKAPVDLKIEELVELNRRTALPFTVFPFALLGLTLGVGARRGGRTYGFALSLAVVLTFYILFFNGIRLALVGKVSPWLGTWGANILLSLAGLLLLAKVDHSFGLGGRWASRLGWGPRREHLPPWTRLEKLRSQITAVDRVIIKSTGSFVARYRFPKVLDVYISRGFLVYFSWSIAVCGTLFVLLTLFDLLDDIIRNRIPISYVVEYFAYYTPQILMMIVPLSVLLAVLINLGILEKNSEITAIKAGGWSLYRIAIPVILISAILCGGLFFMQDYILPYANDRQDMLRNIIKGRPPQTSKRLQRKWIFGESGRIYNYEYFDGGKDSFVDLNIYEVDLNSVRMLRRIHADRARIDRGGEWILEGGWVRDYQSARQGFERITSAVFCFPEKAGYFEKELFQPKESSKLTYPELKGYIQYLMKSGYNATELQVELNKKISFPLSCLIMSLLGVPFSFSTGKKGAFFGIGMALAIAMSYWGISGAFEAMGAYGLLMPALAAWAPNILFGAAGLFLLFTIRT
jgi:LPS export ABC transporter permease LptG/LPS export ABC transporter permease LptF